MSIATETASLYFLLAHKAAERGEIQNAIYYGERATGLLLRPSVESEAPGVVIGESLRTDHLGKVLAAKAEQAMRG